MIQTATLYPHAIQVRPALSPLPRLGVAGRGPTSRRPRPISGRARAQPRPQSQPLDARRGHPSRAARPLGRSIPSGATSLATAARGRPRPSGTAGIPLRAPWGGADGGEGRWGWARHAPAHAEASSPETRCICPSRDWPNACMAGVAASSAARSSSARGMRARAGPSCSERCSPRRRRRGRMVRLPRLAARYPCRSPATPRARPLAQGCLLSAGEGAPSARGCQGAVAAGTTRRLGTRSKSPSALPPDLAGTAGLQRHEPRLTAATPLARRRPPPGAARGGRAEPRARRRRGAWDRARRGQGATGRARGVLCATADFVESVALRIGARMHRCT